MENSTIIKGAIKDYKAGDTVITALQPTTFDFTRNRVNLYSLTQIQTDTMVSFQNTGKSVC